MARLTSNLKKCTPSGKVRRQLDVSTSRLSEYIRQIPSGIHSRLLRGAMKCSSEDSLPMAGGIPSNVRRLSPKKSLFNLKHLHMLGCELEMSYHKSDGGGGG